MESTYLPVTSPNLQSGDIIFPQFEFTVHHVIVCILPCSSLLHFIHFKNLLSENLLAESDRSIGCAFPQSKLSVCSGKLAQQKIGPGQREFELLC